MAEAPLVIDIASDVAAIAGDATVVLVEPLYGVPAVALALDAGWGSVEVAPAADDAPIPLVSFEQPPASEHRGGRCRVRSDDLHEAAVRFAGRELLLGAPLLARPLCAQLAARELRSVAFVPAALAAGTHDPAAGADRTCADAWWASGMLIRILLEELEARASTLTDAAGIAVTLAQGAEDPVAMLGAGLRWRAHAARGGHADDLRAASAIDTVGVVPQLTRDGGALVARTWMPPQP